MILSCSVYMQTVALDCLVTGIAGSTEQDTTRWVTTCLKVLEEVDAANPDGIAVLLCFNSSEKDVSYTVSKLQRCLASTIFCRVLPTLRCGTQLERWSELSSV